MSGLNCSCWVFIVDIGHNNIADIFFDLSSAKFKIAFWSDASFWSFFKSTPTVSEFDSLAGKVDHWIRIVRVDAKSSDLFSGNSLNNLSWGKSFGNDVLQVWMIRRVSSDRRAGEISEIVLPRLNFLKNIISTERFSVCLFDKSILKIKITLVADDTSVFAINERNGTINGNVSPNWVDEESDQIKTVAIDLLIFN